MPNFLYQMFSMSKENLSTIGFKFFLILMFVPFSECKNNLKIHVFCTKIILVLNILFSGIIHLRIFEFLNFQKFGNLAEGKKDWVKIDFWPEMRVDVLRFTFSFVLVLATDLSIKPVGLQLSVKNGTTINGVGIKPELWGRYPGGL